MLSNIPSELRELPQWICWRHEVVNGRQTKVPYAANGVRKASVHDRDTWGDFHTAITTFRSGAFSGIGFVFTADDPYTGIDIDNKPENPASPEETIVHQKILERFCSYTERSVGGYGYHIIIRGKIDGGRDRGHVGVYSTGRYFTFTGDVVRNAPIGDYNELLQLMVAQMPEQLNASELEEIIGPLSDTEVVDMAMRAMNADKFNALCAGDMTGYPSQSEADFALLSILAFYTQDNEQVRRLFRYSALGKRDKAIRNNKYLDTALSKIRAKQPPKIDLSEILDQAAKITAGQAPYCDLAKPPEAPAEIIFPPGLVGEVAEYIFNTSIRPVKEVALTAALAMISGICGRSYNVSNTGLQQYLVLLAKTGTGKEGAASGINRLFAAIRPQVPMADTFIGPGVFASGQALIRMLDEKPCFLSVLGEFGLTLQQICDPRASSAEVTLRRILLDLYGKSGWTELLQSSVYADKEKNTKTVRAPNLTILGEATPESFFEGLDVQHISSGLIPRFSIVEYKGGRPPRNRNPHRNPSDQLILKLVDLVTISLTTSNNQTCAPVHLDNDALAVLDAFDAGCDNHMNEAQNEAARQAWNRAHLKALKLGGLLAVGCNPHQPTITKELADWAIDFVVKDISTIMDRFASGDIGTGQSKQDFDLRQAIEDYLTKPYEACKYIKGVTEELHRDKIIPYDYFRRRAKNISAFYQDGRGLARALKECLADMVEAGILIQLPATDIYNKYKRRAAMYTIGEAW